MAFSDLQRQMFELYGAGHYAEALALVTREAEHFPGEAWRLSQWRVCLASRAGETALAIRILQEALDAGLWYVEERLRADDDLQPLQGNPEYERLVARSVRRAAQAQAEARPELLTLPPEGGRPHSGSPLLMALHGNAENAGTTAPFWQPATGQGWLVGLAQSSQVAGSGAFVWNDRNLGEREVSALYQGLAAQHKIDPRRVMLGGFSMGGQLAVWMALRQAILVRGFVAVAPWVPEIESWIGAVQGAKGLGLRGTIIVGDRDDDCFAGAQALAGLLDAEGIACELQIVPGLDHEYPADFPARLERALKAIK